MHISTPRGLGCCPFKGARWFCCCWFVAYCCSYCLLGPYVWSLCCYLVLCNCVLLILQSSWCGRERERAGCFILTVFLMSYDKQWSVALPNGAMGWSTVCYCGISWSYSLAFLLYRAKKHFLIILNCFLCYIAKKAFPDHTQLLFMLYLEKTHFLFILTCFLCYTAKTTHFLIILTCFLCYTAKKTHFLIILTCFLCYTAIKTHFLIILNCFLCYTAIKRISNYPWS